MKLISYSIFLLSISAILIIQSCDIKCVDPKGATITDNRIVNEFNGLKVEIPANVKLIVGKERDITITSYESYIDAISTKVVRNKLLIVGDVCKASNSDIEIVITTPVIEEVVVSGSADVYSDTPIKSDEMLIETKGSGSISLSIFTNSLEAEIAGSGNIIVNGTCQSQEIEIKGSGIYKGSGLKSFSSKVTVDGSGEAYIVSHNKLIANVNGSGQVNYSGDPEIKISISGSGRVEKMN